MKLLATFFLLSFFTLQSFASIEIDNDKSDCLDGWISMDVTITVDGEDFDFEPSCNSSFDDDFETKSGKKCEVEAGMCSGFSPENKLEVECDDGSDEEIEIYCPRK